MSAELWKPLRYCRNCWCNCQRSGNARAHDDIIAITMMSSCALGEYYISTQIISLYETHLMLCFESHSKTHRGQGMRLLPTIHTSQAMLECHSKIIYGLGMRLWNAPLLSTEGELPTPSMSWVGVVFVLSLSIKGLLDVRLMSMDGSGDSFKSLGGLRRPKSISSLPGGLEDAPTTVFTPKATGGGGFWLVDCSGLSHDPASSVVSTSSLLDSESGVPIFSTNPILCPLALRHSTTLLTSHPTCRDQVEFKSQLVTTLFESEVQYAMQPR